MSTKIFTAHIADRRQPILVREGFSWGAFLFGALWFFWNRLWLTGLIAAAIGYAIPVLVGSFVPVAGGIAGLAVQFLIGLHARDLVRSSLDRRGFTLTGVVAAPDEDAAVLRLYAARPRLAAAARGA